MVFDNFNSRSSVAVSYIVIKMIGVARGMNSIHIKFEIINRQRIIAFDLNLILLGIAFIQFNSG